MRNEKSYRSFEFHRTPQEAAEGNDAVYRQAFQNTDFSRVLQRALESGFRPERFWQTDNDGNYGHLRLTKTRMRGYARITSDLVKGGKVVVYQLYIPATRRM